MSAAARDDIGLFSLLLLVEEEIGRPVSLAEIARWPDADWMDVAMWAAREHLYASDNPVRRLPKPAVLAAAP